MPNEHLDKITIIIDRDGQPVGANLVTDWSSDWAVVKPIEVDPQEPVEILAARMVRMVDVQLALPYDRS